MIWTLVKKDVVRLRRNWITVVVLLAVPLGITGLIGVTFGPALRDGEMPRIKLAMVDEDESLLGSLLSSSVGSDESSKYFDPVFADRDEALRLLNANQISAVVVIPNRFTENFFAGQSPQPIELVKNPAQRYMPAIVEELLVLLIEGLNAVSQNLMGEMPELAEIFADDRAPDTAKIANAVTRIGNKFEQAEDYLFPPLIVYEKETRKKAVKEGSSGVSRFAFVLPGMTAMFLLYMADGTVQDVYREQQAKTLDRYRTVRYHLFPFVVSKVAYSLTIMLLASSIMFGGGAVIFRIDWQHPWLIALLVVTYCIFGVGFIGLLTSLMMNEKRASMLNSVVILLMAFAGGNIMPVNLMPSALTSTISRWLPNYWFNQAIVRLEVGMPGPHWSAAALGLFVCGGITLWISSILFTRRLAAGVRA